EAKKIEDGGDGLHKVRGAEHVAAEVEHDGMSLRVSRRWGQPPRAILGPGGEIVESGDLPEVPVVVERHLALLAGATGVTILRSALGRQSRRYDPRVRREDDTRCSASASSASCSAT